MHTLYKTNFFGMIDVNTLQALAEVSRTMHFDFQAVHVQQRLETVLHYVASVFGYSVDFYRCELNNVEVRVVVVESAGQMRPFYIGRTGRAAKFVNKSCKLVEAQQVFFWTFSYLKKYNMWDTINYNKMGIKI